MLSEKHCIHIGQLLSDVIRKTLYIHIGQLLSDVIRKTLYTYWSTIKWCYKKNIVYILVNY